MTRALLVVVTVLVLAVTALADGMVVPGRAVVKPVRTPEQRALLAFDGKTETLVIETTLAGEGRDFAWIVPLPAAPRIEESTPGLFPTLEVMCGPDVVDHDDRLWVVIPWFGLCALAVAWRTMEVRARRARRWEFAVAMWLIGGLSAMVALAVPTMQSQDPPSAGAIRVLARESVGAFDTATLAATDASALHAWLDANGFRAPAAIDPVADDYARRGWVFVASKVRRDADDDDVRRIRPLAFTFPSANLVYPMRLTGAAADSLALELFVFGASRAEAAGLAVETCDPSAGEALSEWSGPHAELLRRAPGAKCLTKLVGTLGRDAMREDLSIRWTDGKRLRDTYVSAAVARSIAADCGVGAFFVVLVAGIRRRSNRTAAAQFAMALRIGLATALVGWLLAPRLPYGAWEIPTARDREDINWACEPHQAFTDAEAARAWVASLTAGRVNPYDGLPNREEDSPGNWVVRDVDGKIELALYDAGRGGPHEWTLNLSSATPGDTSNVRSRKRYVLGGVVRTATGQPAVGAHVRVIHADPRRVGRDDDWLNGALEATTDDDGRFRVQGLADEKWDVAVDDPWHALLLVEDVDPRTLGGKPLELALSGGVSLQGRVVDGDGQPVASASVLAQPATPFMCPHVRSVAVEADGTFDFPGFTAGSKDVEVTVRVYVADGRERVAKFTATPGGAAVEFRVDLE